MIFGQDTIRITEGNTRGFVDKLLEEGLLTPSDQHIYDLLTPERLQRLYNVLCRRTKHIAVVLEAVDDGHNQAAVLRTVEALGIQQVTVVTGCAPFNPSKGVTQGAHKWLTINKKPSIVEALGDLKDQGYQVLASYLSDDAMPLSKVDVSRPIAVLFGNEHSGVSDEALSLVDGKFVIPMQGFSQSFNISVAAAITLYDLTTRARALLGQRYYLTFQEKRELYRKWMLKSLSPRLRRLVLELEGNQSSTSY